MTPIHQFPLFPSINQQNTNYESDSPPLGPSKSYSWMAVAQTISAAVMSPFIGRLSDIFGRRNFLLLGNTLAAIGAVVAATAHTVNVVIGASIIIGVGSSMHQLAWACLGEVVPNKYRSLALGIFQTSLTPAAAFSSVIGM